MKKNLLFLLVLTLIVGIGFYAFKQHTTIDNAVIIKQVAVGISAEDAIDAMMSKASEVNMKFIGRNPLHKELRARNIKSGRLEFFHFCNPPDARKMVDISLAFSAYMPCRIALVEQDGRLYLTQMDLNVVINATDLPDDLRQIAIRVRDQLNKIMQAGITGDF